MRVSVSRRVALFVSLSFLLSLVAQLSPPVVSADTHTSGPFLTLNGSSTDIVIGDRESVY